jgi:hypothetical protein
MRRPASRRSQLLGAWLAAGLSASLLAGCSQAPAAPEPPAGVDLGSFDGDDGNGLWLVSGDAIAGEVLAAVRSAGAVHATGTFTETTRPDPEADLVRGRELTVDFSGRSGSFDARVGAGASTARILVADGVAHILGNEAYAQSVGAPQTAGTVVCTVGAEPVVDGWAPMLDPVDLVTTLLESAPLAVGDPVGDADVLEIVVGEGDTLGVLTVERYGPPLPRTFTAADQSGDASFTFADWGVDVDHAAAAADLACPEG